MIEEYKNIEGYEGLYQISNMGNVKSLKYGKERILKQTINSRGYYCVNLYLNGKMKTHKVHRLIALAFLPNPDNLPQINHINGIKTDNRIENLEWVTAKENVRHAFDAGLQYFGEKHGSSKLTNAEVLAIRSHLVYRGSGKLLAKKYGVTKGQISHITLRKSRTEEMV